MDGLKVLTNFKLYLLWTRLKVKATWQDYGNCSTLSGVGSILNTLSQEQDASTEEGFKKTKQIAATIMNMLSGIMNAWTSAMSPSNAWMTVAGQIAMGSIYDCWIGTNKRLKNALRKPNIKLNL